MPKRLAAVSRASSGRESLKISNDEIEEMVRDAICMCVVDKEAREAALRWFDKSVALCQAIKELGIASIDDLDEESLPDVD
jgi:hypothetical protein